jgi:ribosomal protein S18 acetylase RimI-like enzyme
MATDSLELETISEKKSDPPTKKQKRQKRAVQQTDSNGIVENGNGSLTESIPAPTSKRSSKKKHIEATLEAPTTPEPTDQNLLESENAFTPVRGIESTGSDRSDPQKFQKFELSTLTDEEDNQQERDQRLNHQPLQYITTDQSTTSPMVQSFTSGENDAVEIHEFSFGDIDAYLEIYFETLSNRLNHFIGNNEQLNEFRKAMKNRLNTDRNSREYQNVLIGKINGEVVSAVTLAFPSETPTVSNDNLLPQSNSCLTPIRRWILRHANYVPTNMEECYIEMIGVRSAFRNHGIGAAMLECVEHFARQAGATLLTIHTNDDRLRNYFQRFGFNLDHTDNSAIWKWMIERQNTHKMAKTISSDGENMDHHGGYTNDSMIDSEIE